MPTDPAEADRSIELRALDEEVLGAQYRLQEAEVALGKARAAYEALRVARIRIEIEVQKAGKAKADADPS